jgi:hypothetical protein
MCKRNAVLTVAGAILGVVFAVASAGAWGTPDRATMLTFNQPVGLPGVTLARGTYLFELAVSDANPNLVRVSNRDRSVVYFSGFTEQIARPTSMPASRQIAFGEASLGVAQPITAWFPAGESVGYRFKYLHN